MCFSARLRSLARLPALLAGLALLATGPAGAQSQFTTPSGGSFVAGTVTMCIVGTGQAVAAGTAVPCGQYGTALTTSGGGGGGGGGGSVTQGSTPWLDSITQWANTTLGAATAWGTAPSGNVPGVNANVLSLPSVAQGTAGSVPWPVIAQPYSFTPLAAPSTPQTITTTAAGLGSIPTGAAQAYLYNSGAVTVLYRWDGVALTGTNGIAFPAQSNLVLYGSALISALQLITASGSSTITVQYTR